MHQLVATKLVPDARDAGSGVNHANDYGHRLYARVILALLVERTPEANDEARTPYRTRLFTDDVERPVYEGSDGTQ